jgi:glycerol-3-phosphate acyltransferase PlsY
MSTMAIFVAYSIGSMPFAWLLARGWGAPDLRRIGSGNVGAANVFRASGLTAGVLAAMLDVAKGATSVVIADRLGAGPVTAAAAGMAAIVGHIYPVWLHFRGGKGVATACGVFAVLTPAAVAPALAVFVSTVWLTKYVSLGSVLASIALPPVAYLTGSPAPAVAVACAASALIVFRHRSNVGRLRTGTERRLGARV